MPWDSGGLGPNNEIIMIGSNRNVTKAQKQATNRLPDSLTEGAILIESLEARGRIREIADRLCVRREGGYHGVDIVVFLILLFAFRRRVSIKDLGELTQAHRRELAALGARKMLPSPPSVSRLLAAVEDDALGEFVPWLLLEGASATDCLKQPAVMMRDCLGQAWHVFDLDPTVTVLRQRALPEGDDLPEPRRRSHEAEAGYTGRKRGDVQLSRATLQHAGSGLWLGIWTQPGNGTWRRSSTAAVETVVRTCAALDHATSRALIRVDGAAGNTPFITTCQRAQVSYLARSAHYTLLGDPEIRAYLDAADWFAVDDSRSGPRRQAAELGWHMLPSESLDETGTRFEQVSSRIVVSKFPASEARGSGWYDAGWHYEMFVTDLAADAMPAPEVVTCYYQRTGIENRFCQEDCELGLDRIFSYHVPGQNLANLVGLLVWNLRICHGLGLVEDLPAIPAQVSRLPSLIEKVVTSDAAIETTAEVPPVPEEATPSAVAEPPPSLEAEESLPAHLARLNWPKLMTRHDGWSWSSEASALLCPAGKIAKLVSVKSPTSMGCGTARFLAAAADCKTCPIRSGCTDSLARAYRKEKSITIPISQANAIGRRLSTLRGTDYQAPAPHPVDSRAKKRVSHWTPPSAQAGLAVLAVAYAVLLPAVLRRLFIKACRNTDVHIDVVPSSDEKSCPIYATTNAQRQRRRLTWAENILRNAISPDTSVMIEMAVGDSAAERLFDSSRAAAGTKPSAVT